MARVHIDPEILAHLEWLGFIRPTGLVVSAPALVRAGAILDRRDAEGQRLLKSSARELPGAAGKPPIPYLPDFRTFAQTVLGWGFSPKAYCGTDEVPTPPELELTLTDYGETLRPDFAVRELEPKDGAPQWQLLVSVLKTGQRLDDPLRGGGRLEASPHSRLERLLRHTRVPAGVLFNGHTIRLLSAPHGQSSGWLDFNVADMLQTAGRPISTALRLLLSEQRLLAMPRQQRFAALLDDSRKFQNEVSERLAEQVLHALYELLRGFQAAHDRSHGELLRDPLSDDPDEVYRALLTVILRLVFLLYTEERDMLPEDETFLRHYSLAALYERLREDAALFPDTMDQRYGAWAQLLVLFRMIHDGAASGDMHLPQRHGVLFDPDRFKFLEGRSGGGGRQKQERIEPPLVPDGTVYRALEKLLLLDGERISYRALDVEQIGSVYETMMGFRLETASGRSVAIKSQKKQGAPAAVDLDALLTEGGSNRSKWLESRVDRKLTDTVKKSVASVATLEDLHAALLPVIDQAATPDLVPQGAMVLQPSEERRRSGSHYTPRELTEPIVRTTLDPLLARLRGSDGAPPTPEAILDLKVCDPAMGSGAFLVEACRYLGDALVEAWRAHGGRPDIPPDEDEVIFARRLVAQRCLYGVDRNPVAVDLAKMSLWLVTLAKDHPLTFVDHALRHGDSLVGLSRQQLEAFHWEADAPSFQAGFEAVKAREHLAQVTDLRRRIREAGEDVSDWELRDLWAKAQFEMVEVRLVGDLIVAAWFEAEKPKLREAKRLEFANAVVKGMAHEYRGWLNERRGADTPLVPFHWEIEFPEVFGRRPPGFDAFVGNPPFMGGAKIWASLGNAYPDWLRHVHSDSGGKAVDLIAHFFRRSFVLCRQGGTLGLVATNTIAQGDTREAGLRQVCLGGGVIYSATRRVKWPGAAAVVVSIVHIVKGPRRQSATLDGREVPGINSLLFPRPDEVQPARLRANLQKSFRGCDIYGLGFLFDDSDTTGQTNSLEEMRALLASKRNQHVIFPYIGGKELTTDPCQRHHRWAINFAARSLAAASEWPDVLAIVRRKVKPSRDLLGGYSVADRRREYWWQYGTFTPALYAAIEGHPRVLAISQTTKYIAFAFLPTRMVYSHKLIVFSIRYGHREFAILQSRLHELWALFRGSTMKDDPVYSTPDCFETFPFPPDWESAALLESVGEDYQNFRAALMERKSEGLTTTYNRFHDPDERDPDIVRLRALHADLDRVVLDAYGWRDLNPTSDFLLDYEVDEEEWGDKKKPYRYRWPDDVQAEVLARLLELNASRAREEARAGAGAAKSRTTRIRKKGRTESQTEGLF